MAMKPIRLGLLPGEGVVEDRQSCLFRFRNTYVQLRARTVQRPGIHRFHDSEAQEGVASPQITIEVRRLALARACMWIAVVVWAIWVGGQTYHAMMVVPIWSVDPPRTLERYTDAGEGAATLPFFVLFTTVWPFLAATVASFAARALPWRERRWIVTFAIGALLISIVLVAWLAPLIWSLILRKYSSPAAAAAQFRVWETANTVRLAVEFVLLLVGMRALIGVYSNARATLPVSAAE
jgi:hypothetical protein